MTALPMSLLSLIVCNNIIISVSVLVRGGLCLGAWLLLTTQVFSANLSANPNTYRDLVRQLKPGDLLSLAPGTYSEGLPLSGLQGTKDEPIVVSGPAGGEPAVFIGRSCCDTVQINNTSYVAVRNLTLDGQRLGVDAVNASGLSHHITLESLVIINHDDHQQTVGISTKAAAWAWVIRNNTILGAGTGMYLGTSSGGAPFVAGLIEHNLIVNTIGYNIEIKHQVSRSTDIGLPISNSKTLIRHNVFSKAQNASSGDQARPNMLVGHFPTSGLGNGDLYEIYGNFFYQNPSEGLFQGEGNIALYDNLFVNDYGPAVSIQPHNDLPRAITVFNNTVVARDTGVRITGGSPNYTQSALANAVFAANPIQVVIAKDNITDSYENATLYLTAPHQVLEAGLDLYPHMDKVRGAQIDLRTFAEFTDSNRDFNGWERTGIFRGAYSGEGTNPGWAIALKIKPSITIDNSTPSAPKELNVQ